MILAGDIGGTKTVLALFEPDGETLKPVREATFPSRAHATFEEILTTFLKDSPGAKPEAACFGVAGAVIDGRVQTTNLPWVLEEGALAETIGARKATLLNDLEAAAYGTLHLSLEEKHVLNPGTSRRKRGNIAVIAAGTGLGEAILFYDGQKYQPIASEGGHGDFAASVRRRDRAAPLPPRQVRRPRQLRASALRPRLLQRLLVLPRHRPRPRARLARRAAQGRRRAAPSSAEVGLAGQGRELRGRARPLRHRSTGPRPATSR